MKKNNFLQKILKKIYIYSFLIFWIYYLITSNIWNYIYNDPRETNHEIMSYLIFTSAIPGINLFLLYNIIKLDYSYWKNYNLEKEKWEEIQIPLAEL